MSIVEGHVIRAVKYLLTIYERRGKLVWARITTTGIPAKGRSGQTVFRKNDAAGFADFIVFLKTDTPKVLHLECKRPAKNPELLLSSSQKAWRDKLASVGHKDYYVVTNAQDLVRVLRWHGIS